MKRFLMTIVALASIAAVSAAEVAIIPRPLSVEKVEGTITISEKSIVVADGSLARPASIFASIVAKENGFEPIIAKSAGKSKSAIKLATDNKLGEEEYILDITRGGIIITGGSDKAVFYGLQSLRQLIFAAPHKGTKVTLDCMTIKDKPHFGYRGGMLDVCRHIFSVEEVKTYIDMLALHKANTFHWHLTEDQGWRIEIKKYPNLTKVGSMRKETVIGRAHTGDDPNKLPYDGKPHGGFFTQEQVRDIVKYATERYIEVIPEIDMPGHMVAALASYPHLGCTGGPYEVRTRWGISEEVLCAGKESTFEFVEGVLDEVLELFPSKFIHIGGDECPKNSWKACPLCQERIRKEGLKNEFELQSYFIHRVENYLKSKGRHIIGWDEILEGGISKTATIMAWRGAKQGIKAAKLGNNVIMTPNEYCYLDYCQTSNPKLYNEPVCGGGGGRRHLPLITVYSFDPYNNIDTKYHGAIKGVQGNIWTEYMPNFKHVQYMALPRMAAIAEVSWSHGNKNYESFCQRLRALRKIYDKNGYNYATFFFNGIE